MALDELTFILILDLIFNFKDSSKSEIDDFFIFFF